MDKSESIDIDAIIGKIDSLAIPDKDKAELLKQIKLNMMHPSHGESENLDKLQAKYITQSPIQPIFAAPPMQPQFAELIAPPIQKRFAEPPSMYQSPDVYFQPSSQSQMIMQQPSYMQPQPQVSVMTTAHFDILKNKLDAVQMELIDLLRHVKDYTQRYMNAVRQQDMEKIDAYINGLFEVDKKMKEADNKAKELAEEEVNTENQNESRESIIGKATSGIKNFIGNIGNNVAGVASLVSNTAAIANNYLSQNIITTSNATIQPNSNIIVNSNTSNTKNNLVSIDEYIKNNTLSPSSVPPLPNVNSPSSANARLNNNIQSRGPPLPNASANSPSSANAGTNAAMNNNLGYNSNGNDDNLDDEVTSAINELNNKMNADIDNLANKQSGGSRKARTLTNKIKLLRLKLTKNNLEKQLKKTKNHVSRKNNKTKNR